MSLRYLVPVRARRAIRRVQRELPSRVVDLPADVADYLGLRACKLPPPRLRYSVAGKTSRKEFVRIGERAAREIWSAASEASPSAASSRQLSVLDFGCGSGRVALPMQRLLASERSHVSFCGADVDPAAIKWCQRSLRGDFRVITGTRIPFEGARFDFIYAVSVFTHMSEDEQWLWLSELRRVLRPQGLLAATTHSPELIYARPDLPVAEWTRLQRVGFAFAEGFSTFNERSAFHSLQYLESHWSRYFELIDHKPFGLVGYQDLAVFRPAYVVGD